MKKIGIILSLLCSCATTTGTTIKNGAKAGASIAETCAKDEVKSVASQIFPAVLAILSSPSDTWKDQMDMYATKYTVDVAVCAAKSAVAKLTAPVQSEGLVANPETLKNTAVVRERELELEAGYSK
jgi:hypothetical protein